MVLAIGRLLRPAVLFAALFGFTVDPLPPIMPTAPAGQSEEFIRWAVMQGGLFVVLLVVLWSYRRDFGRIQAKDNERMAILTDLVGNTRAEIQAAQATNSVLRDAVHELTRELRDRRHA